MFREIISKFMGGRGFSPKTGALRREQILRIQAPCGGSKFSEFRPPCGGSKPPPYSIIADISPFRGITPALPYKMYFVRMERSYRSAITQQNIKLVILNEVKNLNHKRKYTHKRFFAERRRMTTGQGNGQTALYKNTHGCGFILLPPCHALAATVRRLNS